jgi:pilus assembly protein CpaE
MLTAGIVSGDRVSSGQLLASLQQTGMVSSVKEWSVPGDQPPAMGEPVPDVVLLDLGRDAELYLNFGAQVRRALPTVRLIACSAGSAPAQQLLLDAMRSGVQDFVSKPVSPDGLREILLRFQLDNQPLERRALDRLLIVMGSKGGVGTTTVAVNLCVQLSKHAQKRVVLLDLARPLGNAHLLLDMSPRFGVNDAVENLDRLDTHFFGGLLTHHKSGLNLLGGTLHPEQWDKVHVGALRRVVNVAQAGYEMVVLDVGTQFSAQWSELLREARMILMIAEANVPSLWSLERRVMALTAQGVEFDRIRVVINRWHKGDEEALIAVEKTLKRPVFASLPNDFRKASTSVNLGTPLNEDKSSQLTARYRELASRLAGIEVIPSARTTGGGLGAIFGTRR